MIFRNLISKTCPAILHAPGIKFHKNMESFFEALNELNEKKTFKQTNTPDTRIITWNTSSTESPLEKSLKKIGLTCDKLTCKGNWTNLCKFHSLAEHINDITEKFIIVIDSFDAIVIKDLQPLIEWFDKSGLGMMLNGEKTFWPYCKSLDPVCQFQKNISKNCYLNSGVYIARKDFFQDKFLPKYFSIKWESLFTDERDFISQFENIYGIGNLELKSVKTDDQLFCHIVYQNLYPEMRLDYNNTFFQIIKNWSINNFYIDHKITM